MVRYGTSIKKIREALARKGRLTWAGLKEETSLSQGSLSNGLKTLLKIEFAKYQVDTTTRPPTPYYELTPKGWRRQKLWPEAWNEETKIFPIFFEFILGLSLSQKCQLHSLLERCIKLEQWERQRTHEIIDERDRVILRNKKTGETINFILFSKS